MRHRLLWVGILFVIGACELRPAPKQDRGAAKAADATQPGGAAALPPAAAPAPTPPAGGGAQQLDDELGRACMEIGVRIAEVLVSTAGDDQLRARYEQERSTVVRATAEACMRGRWDATLRGCFLAAKNAADLDACNARAPGPGGSRPAPGA